MSEAAQYEDHLEYLPKKERQALEEATYIEKDLDNAAMAIIRQISRNNASLKKV